MFNNKAWIGIDCGLKGFSKLKKIATLTGEIVKNRERVVEECFYGSRPNRTCGKVMTV